MESNAFEYMFITKFESIIEEKPKTKNSNKSNQKDRMSRDRIMIQ